MVPSEANVIELYTVQNLSVSHIAKKYSTSWYQIEKILCKNGIAKRFIADAITSHHLIKYGLKPFCLRQNLSHKDELLKVAGTMLYSGEGTKSRGTVALSNSNPEIIKVFMHFLRRVCGISEDRIHISVHLYEDHNEDELIKFWSDITNVPITQFYKSYLHIRKGGTYREPSTYGTISVQYSDKKLYNLILSWIDEYHRTLSVI